MRRHLAGLALVAHASALTLPALPTAAELTAAKASGDIRLWGVARPRARPVQLWELRMFFAQRTDGDMQRQLGLRAQADADRTSGALGTIAVVGLAASLALLGDGSVNQPGLLPSLRYSLGIAAAVTPFLALAAGVTQPEALRAVLTRTWRLDPAYRRRQTYHEAGHFLLGYLMGLQVTGYDAATGIAAGSNVQFGEAEGGAALAAARQPDSLDRLAVLSMGGVAAEIVAMGDAEGGVADVAQLRELLEVAVPPIRSRSEQDDRIRWGTLMALTLLMQHRPSLDALAIALEAREEVGACVTAIEDAAEPGSSPAAQASSSAVSAAERTL